MVTLTNQQYLNINEDYEKIIYLHLDFIEHHTLVPFLSYYHEITFLGHRRLLNAWIRLFF